MRSSAVRRRLENGKIAPQTMARGVDVDRRDYEKRVNVFTGTAHEIEDAWSALYRTWLPGSSYEPDDRPCLEVYRGNPDVAGRPGAFRCELCIPVRPR